MPITMQSGTPDGHWGNETTSTICQFQSDAGIQPIVVGIHFWVPTIGMY